MSVRESYVWDRRQQKLVPRDQFYREKHEREHGPILVKDYAEPFLSMADGKTIITSRAQYMDHLKRHGCEIVGNERPRSYEAPPLPDVAPVLRDVWNNRHSPGALHNIRMSGRTKN